MGREPLGSSTKFGIGLSRPLTTNDGDPGHDNPDEGEGGAFPAAAAALAVRGCVLGLMRGRRIQSAPLMPKHASGWIEAHAPARCVNADRSRGYSVTIGERQYTSARLQRAHAIDSNGLHATDRNGWIARGFNAYHHDYH
jgi:hypothetical protein